jgi:uncharacterized protein with von Willebrand factor type A (vWA) domain
LLNDTLVNKMEEIVKFSRLLRENNIPASLRSTQTAYETLKLFNHDDNLLNEALASVYVKNHAQRAKFDKVFKTVFEGAGKDDGQSDGSSGDKSSKDSKNRKFLRGYNYSFKVVNPSKFKVQPSEQDITDYRPPLGDYVDNKKDETELLQKDIKLLTSFEPELLDICQKLGKKIANKRVRRRKQSKNMRPDIRKTLRKNLKYGNTLLEIVKTKPRIKKSNHFFLNDVSGSCDWVSNWFFMMVYAAQKSFKKAKTFEFDNKTVETTSALEEPNLLDAFIRVRDIRQKNQMIHGTSNMHRAFESFKDQADLNNKSYVMILSDCRDWAGPKSENKPLSANTIDYLVDKSKKVLILNPEPRKKWNVVDSCVSHYEDSGAEFFEVRNLEQLAELISQIG